MFYDGIECIRFLITRDSIDIAEVWLHGNAGLVHDGIDAFKLLEERSGTSRSRPPPLFISHSRYTTGNYTSYGDFAFYKEVSAR